jgi:hypothetical protein
MMHEWYESSRMPVSTGDMDAGETSGEGEPNVTWGEERLGGVRRMKE